jgi:hypothetical protein
MTYSESAKGVMIDRERVIKELVNHGHMPGSLEWKMICPGIVADQLRSG